MHTFGNMQGNKLQTASGVQCSTANSLQDQSHTTGEWEIIFNLTFAQSQAPTIISWEFGARYLSMQNLMMLDRTFYILVFHILLLTNVI